MVFSLRNVSHFSCQQYIRLVNSFSFDAVSFKTMFLNSFPASSFGLLVKYLVIIRIWWNWHICTGISLKTLVAPRLPSNVMDESLYPSFSKCLLPAKYTRGVSFPTAAQQRFFFSFGLRNTAMPYSLPKKTTSAMVWIFWGLCFALLTSTELICFLIKGIDFEYFSESCRSVCFPQTYSFHNLFWNLLGLFDDWNVFPHPLHLYHCLPRGAPFFLVLKLPHFGHFVRFFKTHFR